MARSVPAALRLLASSRASASSAISRSRSRSATSHSSNSGSFTREAQQQVPAVQLGRLLQRLGSPLGHPPFEGHHVDLHPGGIQRQGLPFDPQGRGVGAGERPA